MAENYKVENRQNEDTAQQDTAQRYNASQDTSWPSYGVKPVRTESNGDIFGQKPAKAARLVYDPVSSCWKALE